MAADSKHPLGDLLRHLMILAYNLDNDQLKAWAQHEMDGYAREADLPAYRARHKTPVQGTIASGFYREQFTLSRSMYVGAGVGDDVMPFFSIELRQPAAECARVLAQHSGNDPIHIPWPQDLIYLTEMRKVRFKENCQLIEARQLVSPDLYLRVVEGVRNTALKLVLELGTASTNLDEIDKQPESVDRIVKQIFNITNVTGMAVGGETAFNINILPGNRQSLHDCLTRLGVSADDRAALECILDEDASASDGVRKLDRALAWAGSLSGVGQLAIAAVKSFFGAE